MSGIITVIIAEDHPVFRDTLVFFLRYARFKVMAATTTGQALKEAIDPNCLPGIAIINYKSTEPSTFNTIQWMKAQYPGIRVMVTTMFYPATVISKFQEMGVEGVIIKSYIKIRYLITALVLIAKGQTCYPDPHFYKRFRKDVHEWND